MRRTHFLLTAVAVLAGGAYWREKQRIREQMSQPSQGPKTQASQKIGWTQLRELDMKTGQVSSELGRLLTSKVEVPGFVIPLEDNLKTIDEFFLVPYQGACIHTPPPPANQIVQVRMLDPMSGNLWDPVWVSGSLQIKKIISPFGEAAFSMLGEGVRKFRVF